MLKNRRIVITGLGMISPLGLNVADTWQALLKGKSGVTKINSFDVTHFSTKIAAQVKNFDPLKYISGKDLKKTEPFIQYAAAASQEALMDSGLNLEKEDKTRIGVAIGSGIGSLQSITHNQQILVEKGSQRISPFFIPSCIINMAPGYVAIQNKLQGPNIAIATACSTGGHNIGYAARTILYGDADMMLAGGTECAVTPLGIGGFCALRSLSTRNDDPEKASRPWDKNRDGFVLGDGAGVLLLEEYEHAKNRNAKIYAELIGFGMSGDGDHMTAPNLQSIERCMENALRDANLSPKDIQYINAHGTSTPVGDPIEALAIQKVFSDYTQTLAVSSTKSMTGHLLGAAGAIEAIISVLSICDQIAPPTINLEHPDINCDLDFIPLKARPLFIDTVMSNSFAFGGTNSSLVFKKHI